MKHMKKCMVAAALAVAVCGFAIAKHHHGGFPGHRGFHGVETGFMVDHLSEGFVKVVSFDANKNGELEATEKESLGRAIREGSVQLPIDKLKKGDAPSADRMLGHIADMYAYLARIDANHDGALDPSEQAILTRDIETGELASLHPRH